MLVVSRDILSVIQAAFTATAVLLLVVKRGAMSCHGMSMFVLHCGRFLKPVSPPAARFLPALYFAQYTKIVQKKLKPSAVESEPTSPPLSPLSPEQLERIARNKRAALDKLTSAQTPPGFGESWRRGLSAEFGKPYFKQVRGLVITLHAVSLCCFEQF